MYHLSNSRKILLLIVMLLKYQKKSPVFYFSRSNGAARQGEILSKEASLFFLLFYSQTSLIVTRF